MGGNSTGLILQREDKYQQQVFTPINETNTWSPLRVSRQQYGEYFNQPPQKQIRHQYSAIQIGLKEFIDRKIFTAMFISDNDKNSSSEW